MAGNFVESEKQLYTGHSACSQEWHEAGQKLYSLDANILMYIFI